MTYRDVEILSIAEIENIIISAIETKSTCKMAEQDPAYDCIYDALEELNKLAISKFGAKSG